MFALRVLFFVVIALALVLPSTSGQQLPPYEDELHLPRCCHDGHALSASGKCVKEREAPFTPAVVINDAPMRAVNVAKDPPTTLTCAASEEIFNISMVRKQAVIFISAPHLPAQLVWKPPEAQYPIPIDKFCVGTLHSASGEAQYIARFCFESQTIFQNTCGSRYCTRKCCPEDQELLNNVCTPAPSDAPWEPVYTSMQDPSVPLNPHPELGRAYGIPQCPQLLVYQNYTLDPKGDLFVPGAGPLFHTHYCLERFSSDGVETKDIAFACFFDKPVPGCRWKQGILEPILHGVSCLFLLITAVVYLSLPGLRSSLNGRCLVAFVLSIFLCFVAIIALKVSRDSFGSFQCTFTAMFALVFMLASFFWFNILCFRMWTDLREPGRENNSACWFVALCGYGFGCPLLVALIGYGLDVAEANAIRPHFVLPGCWFQDKISRWAYQYGILLALLVVDLALFVWSVVVLARRHNTWMIQRSSVANQGVVMFFWLFIIMSISWTLEIVTWQVGSGCTVWEIIADVISALQGFFIFLAAVCFRRDLKVQGKWWIRVPTEDDSTNGRYATSNTELESRTKGTE